MEENVDVEVVKLEDNNDYIIIDKIENNGNKYLILGKNDSDEIYIRKIILENGKEWIIKLDSYEEVEEIMNVYNNKG